MFELQNIERTQDAKPKIKFRWPNIERIMRKRNSCKHFLQKPENMKRLKAKLGWLWYTGNMMYYSNALLFKDMNFSAIRIQTIWRKTTAKSKCMV